MFSLIPIGISNILGGMVLIPAGCERYLLHAQVAGAALNCIANLFFIPMWSIQGAAITTVASEVVVTVVCIYYTKEKLHMDYSRLLRRVAEKAKRERIRACAKLNSRIKKDNLPYYCPCCGTHLNRFIEGGYKNWPDKVNVSRYEHIRQDVICPVCGSLPRHRILALWCEQQVEELKTSKILYFAPEAGIMKWMMRHGVSCTTADLFAEADLQLDIQDTGLASQSYDFIFCNHVLEHVDDYRSALQEVHRVLRKDEKLICSFPMDPSVEVVDEASDVHTDADRIVRFGQADHKRVFGMKADIVLRESGFKVETILGEDCPETILPVLGPADYDMNRLFLCRK